jgi:type I restriction enzyme R subunit
VGRAATANQIEFVNLIIDHLTQRGWMDPALLYESPFTDFSPRGVEGLFGPAQVTALISTLDTIRQRAVA